MFSKIKIDKHKKTNAFDVLTFLLAILTACIMLWYQLGMNRDLVIDANNATARVESDKSEGGHSRVSFVKDNALIMRCTIRRSQTYQYPYCNLIVELTEKPGLDLTKYNQLFVTMQYQSTAPDKIRIYLNHVFDNQQTTTTYPFKMNLYRFNAENKIATYRIQLSDFVVPFWWICANKVDSAHSEFSNVKNIMFSTGESTKPRDTEIKIFKIALRGKWIEERNLYQGLLYIWIVWIVSGLSWKIYQLANEQRQLQKHSRNLLKKNKALDNKSRVLQEQAHHDQLTGLYNRSGLYNALDNLANNQFSLLILDIDHFKSINDELGHDVGDSVLKQLASVLKTRCRESDLVVRWGGEEFLILCRNTDIHQAELLANKLRLEISQTQFTIGRRITCSIGVAEKTTQSFDELFKQADLALYQSKKTGRNKVTVYQS
ncbi:GGDEF domain-containing protein [Catenovulum sediminis]|uniref:diguanylate cyclase n=1 Tax=Catenovulum sediminis TaxID=1740262 RepID=A0ABV1RFI0_9ALTE